MTNRPTENNRVLRRSLDMYTAVIDALPPNDAPIGYFVEQVAEVAEIKVEQARQHLKAALADGIVTFQRSKTRPGAQLWRLG